MSPLASFCVCTTLITSCLGLSPFALECINYSGHRKSPSSPTISETSSFTSAATTDSDTTAVAPYSPSDWERTVYYNGISPNHPELLYRSDLLERPFSTPKGRYRNPSTKTVYGVFDTPLNPVWDTVTPQICGLLKDRRIRYSAVQAARFVTHGQDGEKGTLGPVVVWIATRPATTTAEDAHVASQDILTLLKANGVEGVVVEWYEGTVTKRSGPHLLRVTDDTDPTHYIRRFLTTALGMPIAAAEMEDRDMQGSVGLFFHENMDKDGNPSAKVFGVTNCHVLSKDPTIPYEFMGPGASPRLVRLAGLRRFQRGLDEIKACISGNGTRADLLTREIVVLETKPKSDDPEEVEEDKAAVEAKREKLAKVKKDIGVLETFYNILMREWSDLARRNIGHVDWAPGSQLKVLPRVEGTPGTLLRSRSTRQSSRLISRATL